MPRKSKSPATKASTQTSLAALNTAGAVRPNSPACRARRTAGKAESSSGKNSQAVASVQSHGLTTSGTRSGHARPSAIGSLMSGGDACTIVEPSTNSIIECTTEVGWTTTSMRSKPMSNSRCASMTSIPLFTRVAELIVITGPMSQVGCAIAWSGVTSASSSRVRPRNGPPLAVISRRRTSSMISPRSACASAECSLSTGTIWPGLAASVTSWPPTMSDSLLARASVVPVSRAASVGSSPTEPVMPLSTTSQGVRATSTAACGPATSRGMRWSPSG